MFPRIDTDRAGRSKNRRPGVVVYTGGKHSLALAISADRAADWRVVFEFVKKSKIAAL